MHTLHECLLKSSEDLVSQLFGLANLKGVPWHVPHQVSIPCVGRYSADSQRLRMAYSSEAVEPQ